MLYPFHQNVMFTLLLGLPAISLLGWDFPTQGFAVFALLPIWLYNGRRGSGGRALQCGFSAFYPVHMLVLYLLFQLLC